MPTYSTQTYNRVTQAIITPIIPYSGQVGSMTVYSGEQPTADTVAASWSSYRTTNAACIAHVQTPITWQHNNPTSTTYFVNTLSSVTATALNTGTATWAILWRSDVTPVQAGLTALPDEEFLVVPVGTTASNAIIRFTNTNFVAGGAVTPFDGGITVTNQF
jgi:hypothetical protein